MAKQEVIDAHRTHGTDTGSPEVQVALLSHRISHLTEHLKQFGGYEVPRGRYLKLLARVVGT